MLSSSMARISTQEKALDVPSRSTCSASTIESVFTTIVRERLGALVVSGENFFLSQRDRLVELAAQHRVPTIYGYREFVTAGGLMSYGSDMAGAYRRVGFNSGRILKGEKAADLPVEQATKIEMAVNLKVATGRIYASCGYFRERGQRHPLPQAQFCDIAPVAIIAREPFAIEVHPSMPVKTVPEFVAYAKADPGKINMGSAGIGSGNHIAGELFKMMTGVNLVHVPYRGAGPALVDLLGGQVQVMFASMSSSIEYVRAGKLRALAVRRAFISVLGGAAAWPLAGRVPVVLSAVGACPPQVKAVLRAN